MLPIVLFLAGVVVLVVAMVAVVWAVRGRRIDDHPLCRACGFDLTGKPKGSGRCAECGGDVTGAGAVVIGHRKRDYRVIFGAGAIAGVMGGLVLTMGAIAVRCIDLTPYKPVSWLAADLENRSYEISDAALKELKFRSRRPTPPTAALRAAAERVLAIQSDPKRQWNPAMGDFIEDLRTLKLINEAQFVRYLRAAETVTVEFRSELRRSDPIAYVVTHSVRAGWSSSIAQRWGPSRLTFVTSSGEAVTHQVGQGGLGGELSISYHASRRSDVLPEGLLDRIPDGPIEVRIESTTKYYDAADGALPSADAKLLTTVDHTSTHPIVLLPSNSNNVLPVKFEGLPDSVARGLGTPQLNRAGAGSGMIVVCSFDDPFTPADLAFECFIIVGGKEIRIGTATAVRNDWSFFCENPKLPEGTSIPDTVTLVLRASADAARRSVNVKSYADVELRWDNIGIIADGPTTRDVPIASVNAPSTAPVLASSTSQPPSSRRGP